MFFSLTSLKINGCGKGILFQEMEFLGNVFKQTVMRTFSRSRKCKIRYWRSFGFLSLFRNQSFWIWQSKDYLLWSIWPHVRPFESQNFENNKHNPIFPPHWTTEGNNVKNPGKNKLCFFVPGNGARKCCISRKNPLAMVRNQCLRHFINVCHNYNIEWPLFNTFGF